MENKYPVTPAIRLLRGENVAFEPHLYRYEEHGGTRHSATELRVAEHIVIKTLVMETDRREPLIILMHGDREVSTKELARVLRVKSVAPCASDTAQRLTGYMVGGISPLGTRTRLPVYIERTILDLPKIYLNGGKRGFLISIDPHELVRLLDAREVSVAV